MGRVRVSAVSVRVWARVRVGARAHVDATRMPSMARRCVWVVPKPYATHPNPTPSPRHYV